MNEAQSCCGTARMIHQPGDLEESHLQLFGALVRRESGQIEDWPAVLGKWKKKSFVVSKLSGFGRFRLLGVGAVNKRV